jgi:hypothetical protein
MAKFRLTLAVSLTLLSYTTTVVRQNVIRLGGG